MNRSIKSLFNQVMIDIRYNHGVSKMRLLREVEELFEARCQKDKELGL